MLLKTNYVTRPNITMFDGNKEHSKYFYSSEKCYGKKIWFTKLITDCEL